MSLRMKLIFMAINLWGGILIAIFIFPIPFITDFAGLLSLFVGAILAVLSSIALLKEKNKFLPLFSVLLVILVAYLAVNKAMYWGAWAHFYIHRNKYEATARKILSVQDDAVIKQVCGEDCWKLSNVPPRVAFHYVDSFLNWHDIIYDPTGSVVKIENIEEKKRLNVYFIRAEHLAGDWYLCHFGD